MPKTMQKRRILSVTIRREVDTDPDLSYLGEYGNTSKPTSIDRKQLSDLRGGQYRYFTPALTGDQTGNPKSPMEDYRRMEAYNNEQWHTIGIWAEAEVALTGDLVQNIRSGGLWGLESDSDKAHLASVEREELSTLRAELIAIGFPNAQVTIAFKDLKRKGD